MPGLLPLATRPPIGRQSCKDETTQICICHQKNKRRPTKLIGLTFYINKKATLQKTLSLHIYKGRLAPFISFMGPSKPSCRSDFGPFVSVFNYTRSRDMGHGPTPNPVGGIAIIIITNNAKSMGFDWTPRGKIA